MLKTHVIQRVVDGSPPAQEKITQFQTLVDNFRVDRRHYDVRKTEFFVTPVFGQTAVTLTAIITYVEMQASSAESANVDDEHVPRAADLL